MLFLTPGQLILLALSAFYRWGNSGERFSNTLGPTAGKCESARCSTPDFRELRMLCFKNKGFLSKSTWEALPPEFLTSFVQDGQEGGGITRSQASLVLLALTTLEVRGSVWQIFPGVFTFSFYQRHLFGVSQHCVTFR